ncbi:MAG: hypothetical protein AAF633_04885 [Chloroflexota bacterium]
MTLNRRLTLLNWGAVTLLFLGFLAWHGAFEGPMTEAEIRSFLNPFMTQLLDESVDLEEMSLDEIDDYLEDLQTANAEPIPEVQLLSSLLTFLREDDGRPVVMVNLLDERDGSISANGETAEAAFDEYGDFVFSYLIRRGSYPIYSGDAAMDAIEIWGVDDAEEWTSAGLVRYRSRRVMFEMTTNPEFSLSHDDKVASLEKTIAVPTGTTIATGDLSLTVGLFLLSAGLGTQLLINRRKTD